MVVAVVVAVVVCVDVADVVAVVVALVDLVGASDGEFVGGVVHVSHKTKQTCEKFAHVT